jgi:hypothetical protein
MTQTNLAASSASDLLFNGYDSISAGMLAASAVTGGTATGGIRKVVNIEVCESESELAKALEIDGSLSVSYLKAANVTAKMEFVQNLNVTARSVTIVVYAYYLSGTTTAKKVELADGITAPKDDEELADFADHYGDSFVSEASEGAEYYGVYTFHTETREQQEELKTSLKAKGVGAGVTVKADVQAKLSDFLKTTSTNWSFKQQASGHSGMAMPSQDKLIEFALAFSEKKPDSPVITGFKVMGYERATGMTRKSFAPVIANRDYFLGKGGLLLAYARLGGVLNQIAWLKRIYACYNYTGDAALLAFETTVKDDLDKIDEQIKAYTNNPTAKQKRPDLPSLAKGEPVLHYAAGQSESFGGGGGGPFDFMSAGQALSNQVKVASIRFADGDDVIHQIEVGYVAQDRTWKTIQGAGGVWRAPLDIERGQFPVHVAIRCDDKNIFGMMVQSSDGNETSGGSNKGRLSKWDVPRGAVLLGFAGRSGALLDQITMKYATLQPALYVQPI